MHNNDSTLQEVTEITDSDGKEIKILPPSEKGQQILADTERMLQEIGWSEQQQEATQQQSKRHPAAGQYSRFDLMPMINRTIQNLDHNKNQQA